ncbi:MAG: hypothetical protein NT169_26350, partial [Chloroflexi bacterium]|nr:hypothetical protein [Chloroflexota bacterium]
MLLRVSYAIVERKAQNEKRKCHPLRFSQWCKIRFSASVILSGLIPNLSRRRAFSEESVRCVQDKFSLPRRDPSLDSRRNALHGTDPLRVTKADFALLRFSFFVF